MALAVVAVAGLGAAAYLGDQYMKERDRTAELAEKNRSLSDALQLHRTSKVELDSELTECKDELDVQKTSISDTSTRLLNVQAQLTTCRTSVSNLEDQRKKAQKLVDEFERLTARFQKMIDTGKLDVVFRRGQMIVKLPARVLFPSGKAVLSEGGKEAIAEVAKVLRTMRRRRFTVAGHTDNVPVRGEEFASNWELSTARAVTVTSVLIENGVKPRSLVAAGYGPYAPVAKNRSPRGRQRNRRIEIILEPNLKSLPLNELRARARRGERSK